MARGTTDVWLPALRLMIVLAVQNAMTMATKGGMRELKPMFLQGRPSVAARQCSQTTDMKEIRAATEGRPQQLDPTRSSTSDRTEYSEQDLLW